eukprot:CAMPEP_0197458056 /NCGR_PEP_ID=MMETSP1175-20131217/47638_1 /TAXON_ID=1003142 /ORGANISM="Triceratium dubium, Strain CCMP147" /LENGTH=68 /DNA_ID=CAMNT_0042992579 /DNA_START=8 /DNA_END=211 /DNA_ORIENTATION=-
MVSRALLACALVALFAVSAATADPAVTVYFRGSASALAADTANNDAVPGSGDSIETFPGSCNICRGYL